MTMDHEARKVLWIEGTQMFERIAGVPESSSEDLSSEFDEMNKPKRRKTDAAKSVGKDTSK
jgi:hypothetical protein